MSYEAIARFLKTAYFEYCATQWTEEAPDFYSYITRRDNPTTSRFRLSAVGIGRDNIVEVASYTTL